MPLTNLWRQLYWTRVRCEETRMLGIILLLLLLTCLVREVLTGVIVCFTFFFSRCPRWKASWYSDGVEEDNGTDVIGFPYGRGFGFLRLCIGMTKRNGTYFFPRIRLLMKKNMFFFFHSISDFVRIGKPNCLELTFKSRCLERSIQTLTFWTVYNSNAIPAKGHKSYQD